MDQLIRDRLHEALDVEPTPTYLRSQIMRSLPAAERRARWRAPHLEWARPWVAALLAIAVVIGLIAAGRALGPQLAHRLGHVVTPAFLSSPEGIAVAPDGSVYFTDYVSAYVFRIEPNGSLVTVAGSRPNGSIDEGDLRMGGSAIDGYLFYPDALAFDRKGNLYIADGWANRVRRIDRKGVITTFAGSGLAEGGMGGYSGDGGPATRALLNFPASVAVDAAGNVYIGDYLNHKIRMVDTSGRISSLDDSTLPIPVDQFAPGGLAFDAAGNLYVGSSSYGPALSDVGCAILRRTPAGVWSMVAGSGACGFSGDGGPATAAQITSRGGIAFDAAGNLYVADTINHRIRRVDARGVITTVAAGLEYPESIAVGPGGKLYIAEEADESITPSAPGRISVLQLSDGTLTTIIDSKTPIRTSG